MADIFLSYKKDDRGLAERLVGALRNEGKSVWWDDALSPAEAWDSMIEKEIASSRVVLVLWSPRSVQSDWVRSEAHYAQDHHKLIPVIVEDCSIPLAFRLRQAVDLSDGRFDHSNPNWDRLLSWIDAVRTGSDDSIHQLPDEASPEVAAAAAVPAKVQSGDRWLSPAARHHKWLVGGAALAVLAMILFLGRGLVFGQGKVDVYVDPFTVAGGGNAIPAGFAQSVNSEISAQLNAASLITPLDGDGKPTPNGYRMSGTIQQDGDKLVAYAKIFAPGIAAPVLSPRLEVSPERRASAAKILAADSASILRCIATASDSSGAQITVLPEKAIRPWAQFCQMSYIGDYDATTVDGYLKAVVKAAPDFANGWANIAENKFGMLDGPDRAQAVKDLREAYTKALDIDSDNQKALMMKAADVVGSFELSPGRDKVMPFRNFEEFDRLTKLANNIRPSDCGCEAIIASRYLLAFGRPSAALPLISKASANDPANLWAAGYNAMTLEALGRSDNADQIVKDVREDWPGIEFLNGFAARLAIGRHDWAAAEAAAQAAGDFPVKKETLALIAALKSGNPGAANAAADSFLDALSKSRVKADFYYLLAAAAGREEEVVGLMRSWAQKGDYQPFMSAWLHGMEKVRALPDFALLTRQMNLPAYWKLPGHRPDSCATEASAPYCTY